MQHTKQHYINTCPSGWNWVCFDKGLHCYQCGNYRDGFRVIRCYESEIIDGSLLLLIKLGMTR
jgi:hypothetical protein